MITRFVVALAFVGMLLSVGAGRAYALDSFEGNINSCSDIGADYVDAGGLVTVTANDGTYLSYTATVAVTAAVKGGPNYTVYAAATSGVGLHAPLNGGGNVPAISHYLFCYVPGGEPPVDEAPTCATDPALCPVDEAPTCATDPALCGDAGHAPVTLCHATGSDANPFVTITTDDDGAFNGHLGGGHQDGRDIIPPFMYDSDNDGVEETYSQNYDADGAARLANGCEAPTTPIDEPTCATDPSLCEQPIDEQPIDEQPIDEQPIDEQPSGEQPSGEQPSGETSVGDDASDGGQLVDQAPVITATEAVTTLSNTGAGPVGGRGDQAVLLAGLLALLSLAAGLRLRPQPTR